MPNTELAAISNHLFTAAFVCYVAAMLTAFFRLAFTRVSVVGVAAPTRTGERVGAVSLALTVGGAAVHLASVVTRGLAAGRPPWMNMYEYSSLLALVAVLTGLVLIQRRPAHRNVMGFVLFAAILMMGSALLLYAEAAPVQPALDSWWRNVHVTTIGFASAVFMVGFAFAALYLVKDTAERRLAERSGEGFGGSTVGAARVSTDPLVSTARVSTDPAADSPLEDLVHDEGAVAVHDQRVSSPMSQREVLSPWPFTLVPFVAATALALVLSAPVVQALAWGLVIAVLGAVTWWAVPFLPDAANLDNLAYRINAFAFPIYTFAVITGAIWAEVAWGRYWGWDPKETSAFFTWVFYAGYLHARSTRGWRGRRAAWVNVVAYVSLIVTYYVVNLLVAGLHSYAGVD